MRDGQRHTLAEMAKECLEDKLAEPVNICPHLHRVRKVINRQGMDIITEMRVEGTFYRYVRMLASPYNGG